MIRNATNVAVVDIGTKNQLSDQNILIGFLTRQKLLELEGEGMIVQLIKMFLHGISQFYIAAVEQS